MQHPIEARKFNEDETHVNWHDQALWFVRQNRDHAANKVSDWEDLRDAASKIKANVLSNLDTYLLQFEEKALENGIAVHWASDANEHNDIVYSILRANNATKLVKSKSMLTEECHLNSFLQSKGIDVIDTDLGERIVQLANESPSHIVMPAIHKKREEVDELFHQRLGTKRSNGDAVYLTREARKHLRKEFLQADASLTGVNFAIAETGGFVVCTNEGNADMGVNCTPIHIASMGIEKIIPKLEHLGIFLRLLARSGTGQPITSYSSHFHKPFVGTEIHIVIVDNGRSTQLGRKDFRNSLHCIRCGACINTCPVYRRSGGHSYDTSVPGPIGSVLSPGKDLSRYSTLPFASTLCGSCADVCPVKIELHTMLYKWRQIITTTKKISYKKKLAISAANWIFTNPNKYRTVTKWGRRFVKMIPEFIRNRLTSWGKGRDLPQVPKQSFDEWYRENRS